MRTPPSPLSMLTSLSVVEGAAKTSAGAIATATAIEAFSIALTLASAKIFFFMDFAAYSAA
jgi:hypothetical protein